MIIEDNVLIELDKSDLKEIKNTGTIIIPNDITEIKEKVFIYNEHLKRIIIPKSVKIIGERALECPYLESIVVEDGNLVYDSRDNCNALIETKTNTLLRGCANTIIPNTVTVIDEIAFISCKGLKKIDIPESVEEMRSEAFYGCSDLETINIKGKLDRILFGTFSSCTSLKRITFPKDLKIIESEAFRSCLSLKYFDVPKGVREIEEYAFYECDNLLLVTIPSSVKKVGVLAFPNNEKMVINCDFNEKPSGWNNEWASGLKRVIWGRN